MAITGEWILGFQHLQLIFSLNYFGGGGEPVATSSCKLWLCVQSQDAEDSREDMEANQPGLSRRSQFLKESGRYNKLLDAY